MAALIIMILHVNGAAVMLVPETMPTRANQNDGYCSNQIMLVTVEMVLAMTHASAMITRDAGQLIQRSYVWNLKMAAVVYHILIPHVNGAAVMLVPETMTTNANQKNGYCGNRIISATVKMVSAITHVHVHLGLYPNVQLAVMQSILVVHCSGIVNVMQQ
jgi:hypothetical protein